MKNKGVKYGYFTGVTDKDGKFFLPPKIEACQCCFCTEKMAQQELELRKKKPEPPFHKKIQKFFSNRIFRIKRAFLSKHLIRKIFFPWLTEDNDPRFLHWFLEEKHKGDADKEQILRGTRMWPPSRISRIMESWRWYLVHWGAWRMQNRKKK